MLFCGYCGAQMPDDMRFCTKCGKPLLIIDNTESTETNNPADQPESSIVNPDAGIDPFNNLQPDARSAVQSDSSYMGIQGNDSLNGAGNSSGQYNYDNTYVFTKNSDDKKKIFIPLALTIICVAFVILMIMIKNKPAQVAYSGNSGNSGQSGYSVSSGTNSSVNTTGNSSSTVTASSGNTTSSSGSTTSSSGTSSSSSGSASISYERRERDGSSMRQHDYYIAFCRISVPIYWAQRGEGTASSLELYAESEKGRFAGLRMEVSTDNNGDYSWFKDERRRNQVINERLSGFYGDMYLSSMQYYESGSVSGIMGNITADNDGDKLTGKIFFTPSKDYKRMITIAILQNDSTLYLYNEEFVRIIDTIELLDGSWPPPAD